MTALGLEPTLRERRADILPLARVLLGEEALRMNRNVSELTPQAADRLLRYVWPGNVRELENATERAVALAQGRREGDFRMFADVDGDGLDDAILQSAVGDSVWLQGEASGRFAEMALPFSLATLEGVVFGDRNGDAATDALLPSPDASSVLDLHLGDGEGGFSLGGSLDLGVENFWAEVHPLGEGLMLLVLEEQCVGFCPFSHVVVVVEVTQVGALSELTRFSIDAPVQYLDSLDRNGDGLPDLLLDRLDRTFESGSIGWYDSPGYREIVEIEPSEVHQAADLDLDGAVDVIELFGPDEPGRVRFGIAGEGLGPAQPLVGELPSGLARASADFDGDGLLDLVSSTGQDSFAIWSVVPCEG